MAEAPAGNETLTERDAVEIYEELLPAQNQSYVLGLKFKLEPHVVEAIHSRDMAPGEYLLQIIMEFTRQTEPRPTWRVIVEVLRSPAVRLPALAQKVEAAHFPDLTSSRDVVPETTATESAATGTTAAAAAAGDEVKSKPSSQPTTASVAAVQKYTKSSRQMPSSTEEFKIQRSSDNQIIVSGAHLFTKQSFSYTGKQVDFIWEEAGISLHFPAVDWVGEIKISVAVVENVDAHSILPQQYRFMPAASATYKITASATLPAPVRVRIQHCAITEKEDALIVMVAHEGPPYYFKPLPGGHFPPKSSYGEIETYHFSLFRFFLNLLGYRECPPMRLSVQIFYHEDNTATFVVTKNLHAHITAVKQTTDYISMEDMRMSCEPTTDAITLSVPVDSNGWRITPSFEPAEIRTLDINTYEPGETCPKIKLHMEWKGSGQPREELVPLSAHGGSINSFTLLCKPRPQTESAQGQSQPPAVGTIQLLRNSDTPTLPNLLRFPTLSGAAINIVQEATQNSNFGILLLNDENGTITGNITTEHGSDPVQVTRAIFRQWLQGTGREPISWATLTAVLREANLTASAHKIEKNLLE